MLLQLFSTTDFKFTDLRRPEHLICDWNWSHDFVLTWTLFSRWRLVDAFSLTFIPFGVNIANKANADVGELGGGPNWGSGGCLERVQVTSCCVIMSRTRAFLIAFAVCFLFQAVLAGRSGYNASDLSLYRYRQVLGDSFTLLWDGDAEWIHVAMVAETHGWVAIGIAEQTSGRYVWKA